GPRACGRGSESRRARPPGRALRAPVGVVAGRRRRGHRMSSPQDWDWSLRIFDHVDVHASDYSESVRFYETVLAPLGIPKLAEGEDWTCFANLNIVDRQPPTQNLHLCFFTREREQVDAFHRAGVEAGFHSN